MNRAPSEPFGTVASISPLAGRLKGAPVLTTGSGASSSPLALAAETNACHPDTLPWKSGQAVLALTMIPASLITPSCASKTAYSPCQLSRAPSLAITMGFLSSTGNIPCEESEPRSSTALQPRAASKKDHPAKSSSHVRRVLMVVPLLPEAYPDLEASGTRESRSAPHGRLVEPCRPAHEGDEPVHVGAHEEPVAKRLCDAKASTQLGEWLGNGTRMVDSLPRQSNGTGVPQYAGLKTPKHRAGRGAHHQTMLIEPCAVIAPGRGGQAHESSELER